MKKFLSLFSLLFLLGSPFAGAGITRSADGRFQVENLHFGLLITRADWYTMWQNSALTFPAEFPKETPQGLQRQGIFKVNTACSYKVTETIKHLSANEVRIQYDFILDGDPSTRYHGFGTMLPVETYKQNPLVIDGKVEPYNGNVKEKWIKGKHFVIPLKNCLCELKFEKGISNAVIKLRSKMNLYFVFAYKNAKQVSTAFTMRYIPYETAPVDLKAACNMGFADPVADDKQGGWTDQGPANDLSAMKPGKRQMANVTFDVINPDKNNGKSCIVLQGKARPYFPASAKVAVPELSGNYLYLLNGLAWPPGFKAPAGKVLITYADGQTQEYILKRGIDTDNFWGVRKLDNAEIAWKHASIGLFATRIPLKNKPVTQLEFISVNQIWMIVGASIGNAAPPPRFTRAVIKEGKDWVHLPYDFSTAKGSVADFSFLLDAPAGKHGFVTVKDGHFVFADGTPARFWGVNTNASFHYGEKEHIAKVVEQIAACGYNAIRLHHFDNGLMRRRDPETGKPVLDHLNPPQIDKLDFLLNEAKKRGIYVTLDFFTIRWWARVPKYDTLVRGEYKVLAYFDEAIRGDLIRIAKELMSHKNPYTGLRWADDPAIIFINFINEGTLTRILQGMSPRCKAVVEKAYDKYLADRKIGNTPENRKAHYEAFLEYTGVDFFNHLKKEMRDIGVKIPFSDQNFEPVYGKTRHHFDYVDFHFYWNHPTFFKKGGELPASVGSTSALTGTGSPYHWVFHNAIAGKPMVISEWNFCYPNPYIFEGGILTGAYSALQNYDGLMHFYFAALSKEAEKPRFNDSFLIGHNPLMKFMARTGAMLFLRGDVKPAPLGALVTEKAAPLAGGHLGITTGFRRISDNAPAGVPLIAAPDEKDLPADRKIIFRKAEKEFVKELQNHKVIPAGNGRDFASVTGELVWTPQKQNLKVMTPRTEALVLRPGQTLAGHFMQVRNENAPAAFFLSGLDGKPLNETGRMVLMHLTDIKCDGITFGDKEMSLWEKYGDQNKLLLRRNRAEVTLNTARRPAKIYACCHTGKRLAEVPTEYRDGKLLLKLDNTLNGKGVMLYELLF